MPRELSGILLLDKPGLGHADGFPARAGDAELPTSHDMVQRVRKALGIRRVGHSGTLDPFASGLLVVCVGKATRLAEYYQELPKTYSAQVRFGAESTTDDITGEPRHAPRPVDFDREALATALTQFVGELDQVPPTYSAKKIQGRRAYDLARGGQDVPLKPQRVHVHAIQIETPLAENHVSLQVRCSSGTYIRSLARDLGRVLGCGACLVRLRRLSVGDLHVDGALVPETLSPDALRDASGSGWLEPGTGLSWPTAACAPDTRRRLGYGQVVDLSWPGPQPEEGSLMRATDEDGSFLGVLECVSLEMDRGIRVKARKWLAV